jgi:hypothetical protein
MIMTSVQDMVDFVINLFNTFSPTIIANITSTLTTISAFWSAHGAEVMAVVSFLFNTLATVIGGTLTLITGIISTAITFATGIWTFWSALLQGDTATAWTIIRTTIGTALNTILATLTTILASALSITGTSLAAFIASWTGTFTLAVTIVQTFFSNLIASWTGNWSLALSIVQGFIANTIAAVVGFALSLTGQFNSLVASIQSAFSIDWGSIGSGIIGGIVGGVMNAAGGLAQAAADAARAAFDAAKRALGISSPSRLFTGIGANMMAGMALGIGQNARLPVAAIAGALSQDRFQPVVVRPSNTFNFSGGSVTLSAIENVVRRVLAEAGQQADTRRRTGQVTG